MGKKLATINRTAPVALDLGKCVIKHYNEEGARELLRKWGFHSLQSRLPKSELSKSQPALF